MKNLLSAVAVFIVLFIGCSNDVNINNPVDNLEGWEVVTRSTEEGLQVNSIYYISKSIVGAAGGLLSIGNSEETKSGKINSIYGSLYFQPGCFSGTKTITMSLDDKKLLGTFGPSMSFIKPAYFSVLFAGVNLSSYSQSDFKFVYWASNNTQYEISSTFLYFDKVKGVLGILNAQLPHFSRYAFVRKSS